jgi:Ca2+-dependent lipid-binding protein
MSSQLDNSSSAGTSAAAKQSKKLRADLGLYSRICGVLVFSHIIGYLSFSYLYILILQLLIVFGIVRYKKSIEYHSSIKFQRLLHDSSNLELALYNDYKDINKAKIPSWVSFTDLEKVDWLQNMLKQMWPQIKEATEKTVESSLTPLFASLKPGFLSDLGFYKLDLGNIAPHVKGVKIQNYNDNNSSNDEMIMLDMDVESAGNPIIQIEAKSGPINVVATLADFQMFASVRVLLKPLIVQWPCFGAISISFTRKPEINFRLETGNVNVMSIPGLNQFLNDMIKTQVSAFLVWPKKIVIPMSELSELVLKQLNESEPVGIIAIKVHAAKDLRPMDSYVRLVLGNEVKKTAIIKGHSKEPTYDEEFEFQVVDPRTEVVTLQVKGKQNVVNSMMNVVTKLNVPSTKGITLGECHLQLDTLTMHNAPNSMWLPLQQTNKKYAGGHIHLTTQWKPFRDYKSNKFNDSHAQHNTNTGKSQHNPSSHKPSKSPPVVSSKGVLIIILHSASKLQKSSGSTNVDPYCFISLGQTKIKTEAMENNPEPKWELQEEIRVKDSASQTLIIEVRDKNRIHKDELLGEFRMPISQIQAEGGRIEKHFPLSGTQSGATIYLSLNFREYE